MVVESAPMPGHLHEEHTGELRIRLWARSLAELFEEAARALGDAMGGGARLLEQSEESSIKEDADQSEPEEADPEAYRPDLTAPPTVERVTLEAPDSEALLVDWLNELIFRAEVGRKIFAEARIEQIDARSLAAEITGRPAPLGRTFVKAATFHGLQIEEVPGGLSACVLLDI
jgi:SHS2 domain-containing protein